MPRLYLLFFNPKSKIQNLKSKIKKALFLIEEKQGALIPRLPRMFLRETIRQKNSRAGILTWRFWIFDFGFWIEARPPNGATQNKSKIQNQKSKIELTVTRSCGILTRLPYRPKLFCY